MFRLCDHGLFVGASYYRKLPACRRLASTEDARALQVYFDNARPGKNRQWRLLTGNGRRPPTRVEVKVQLREFLQRIPDGGGGIFYFSGHAQLGTSGLLLKCHDADDASLEDSALRLEEVLKLLGTREDAGVQFFVILDCCREGESSLPVDRLPSNVCALYGCLHGGAAVQDPQGGVLTRSILGALNGTTTSSRMSARALYRRARQWAFRRNPLAGLGFELVGCRTDDPSIPLQGSKTAVAGGATPPIVTLRYSPESEKAFLATFWGLKKATLEWYGFSVSDPRARRIFEDYFWDRQRDAFLCEVRLPDDGVPWNASEFLLHLADALVYTPAVLLFRWPRPLEVESVRWIGSIVNRKWHSMGPMEIDVLIWEERIGNDLCFGKAYLANVGSGSEVAVTCETEQGTRLPLSCLRSTVCDVYEAFRSVQPLGEAK